MRKDYLKKYINTLITIHSCSPEYEHLNSILDLLTEKMCEIWHYEYKSFDVKHRKLLIQDFWNQIHTELESQQDVYKFTAIFGEEVNPPGSEGNVELWIQPNHSAQYLKIKLQIKNDMLNLKDKLKQKTLEVNAAREAAILEHLNKGKGVINNQFKKYKKEFEIVAKQAAEEGKNFVDIDINQSELEIKDEYSETHWKYFVIRDTSLWLFKNWLEEQNFTNYHIWRCDTPEKDPGCFSKNYSLRISWQ